MPEMVTDDEVTSAHHDIEKADSKPHHNEAEELEEKPVVEAREFPKLQRRLKSRHLQMIAIGMRPSLEPTHL